MKPQNSNERKKSFGVFLIFYIISIVVLTAIIFSIVKVPSQENKHLKEKIVLLENEQQFNDDFLEEVGKISKSLDSTRTISDDIRFSEVESNLSFSLKTLKGKVMEQKPANELNYTTIVNSLIGQLDGISRLRKLGDKDASIAETKAEIDRLTEKLNDCKRDNQMLELQLKDK